MARSLLVAGEVHFPTNTDRRRNRGVIEVTQSKPLSHPGRAAYSSSGLQTTMMLYLNGMVEGLGGWGGGCLRLKTSLHQLRVVCEQLEQECWWWWIEAIPASTAS